LVSTRNEFPQQFSGKPLNSTLDKKEREFYVGRPSNPSVPAARARIAGKKAFTQDRSKRKKSSHIASSGKGVQLLPFLKSKKKFTIKGGTAWLANQIY
jgi:hypothetical protein